MVKRVVKASTGAVNMVANSAIDGMVANLSVDDIGDLEPEFQDMVRAGPQKLDDSQKELLFYRLVDFFQAKESKDEQRKSLWQKVRASWDQLLKDVQYFVRGDKKPTQFTTPPLGQGERLDLFSQRMARILQSWRRGKRVDVMDRMTDDGALTLYFDDFGDFGVPVTFAVRVAQRGGALYSVDFQPGQGELERLLGDAARAQLRQFFQLLLTDPRGHDKLFHRFVRRMNRAQQPSKAPLRQAGTTALH